MNVKTILAALLFALFVATAWTQEVRLRKNIDDLSDDELADYMHAFELLKEKSPSELDSYETFQRLHNGGNLPNGKVGGCIHSHGDFLPWHRMLLSQFETALQNTDSPRTANVMLPYWDFSKASSGNRFPAAFEDQSSVLWHANRLNLLSSTPPEWAEFIEEQEAERQIFMDADFLESTLFGLLRYRNGGGEAGFSNGLESSPHNVMHTPFTLGDMADDVTAAKDPIFWSFHCYIDLMWHQWQLKHGAFEGAEAALLPADLAKEYDHFPAPMTVGEVLDPEDLGYTYVLATEPPLPTVLVSAADRLAPLAGRNLQFQWKAPARARPGNLHAADAKIGATLTVSGVKHSGQGSWKIEIYLHPKNVEPDFRDREFKKTYLAAQYVEWHGNHRPAHHAAGQDLILRLAEKQVQKSIEGGDYVLSVHYRALPSSIQDAVPTNAPTALAAPFSYESLSVKFD